MNLLFGLLLAAIVSFVAFRAHALNKNGALSATLMGAIIFGLGGLSWSILLLAFFISSTLLSRAFKKQKINLNEKYSKGHERDFAQVLGNGGVATIFVLIHVALPNASWPFLGFAAALAAVNADTWATELGALNRTQPRLITSGRLVDAGTSGAISIIGTLAALSGSALIGILAALSTSDQWALITENWLLITVCGLAGCLFDSLLGATVQAIYFCPQDSKETEQHPRHSCGTETVHLRGWKWLTNDWVNFLCGAFGAGMVLTLTFVLL